MPHIIVKLWPGKSDDQKTRLAHKIARDVMEVIQTGEETVSVAFEEVNPRDPGQTGAALQETGLLNVTEKSVLKF